MAKRKSENFLPKAFQTLSNRRLLNATVDPLIQEPSLKKMYGYIGQQDQSPVYNKTDYYINESDSYSQFYQLEPGTIIKKRQYNTNTYKVDNVYNYVDLLNQISSDGGLNGNHDRLFNNRYYSWNGFVDLDKLTNYRQYYWVPGGPQTVDVTATNVPTLKDFYFHRNSYITNNQTELQSAALGATGYTIDTFGNEVNPTITLVRGGIYNFNVNQDVNLWIQTEIGTSGVSGIQDNISTRDVLGVTNNGSKSGTITFAPPLKNAQDQLINYDLLPLQVDLIVDDINYNQVQGANYDSFILENALDGVRAFDNKYVVFTSLSGWSDPLVTGWDSDYYDGWDEEPFGQDTTDLPAVTTDQIGGVFRINVNNDPLSSAYRTINLTYIGPWNPLQKVFVTQGANYGHVYAYKDQLGTVKKFPTLSASLDVLYYQDESNPLVYGQIQLIDPQPNSLLNVNDIIGRKNYTSPNGVKFTSGLKVKFTGIVVPTDYQEKEFVVEGVGSSIKLINYKDLVTSEKINTNAGVSFGSDIGFDASGTGYDGSFNSPEQKDYITINRASMDGNSWSRDNRWFHRDVLLYAAQINNSTYVFDSNQQAKRPIVEFLPNIKLFNHGVNYIGPVTCFDSSTTDAFSQVEGYNTYALQTNGVYNSDGIPLLNGVTVVFINDNDPTVRQTIYQVQNNKTRSSAYYGIRTYAFNNLGDNFLNISDLGNIVKGQHVSGTGIPQNTTVVSVDYTNDRVYISNKITQELPASTLITFDNTYDQIHLVPLKIASDGDTVVALEGIVNQGNMYYYENGVWNLAQIRNSRPQFPLFDVIDINGNSLGDQNYYASSTFAGSKLFGYAVGTGTRDSELGFPLVYKSIGNLGDIVFENYYKTDSFHYALNQTDQIKNINIGFAPIIKSYNNYDFANGWYRVSDKSKQYITKIFTATAVSVNNFDLNTVYTNSYYENNLFVYVNGIMQTPDTYTFLTNNTTSQIVFNTDLNVGDRLFVKIYGTTNQFKQNYTMPRNFTNNSENTEFSSITLGQVRNHLIEIGNNLVNLQGQPAGANNFRDLNFNYVGGKLLQHSASLRPAALLFANRDVNPVQFIRYAADSYAVFKAQLLDFIQNREFSNPTNYRDSLDQVLAEFSKVANVSAPFYYTDMVSGGNNFIKNSYNVANTNYRTFNLTQDLSDELKGYRSLLVYVNGVLLLKNNDYTIVNKTVKINTNVVLTRNDLIEVYEYASSQGCNVTATPTKLGIYPKYKPEIVTDNSYINPVSGIIGHDGSFTIGWGDYRDNILLEFEKRVYNNITVTYAEDGDINLSSIIPGAFRNTDYSISEWTQLLAPQYLRWAHANNADIFSNNTFTGNPFTWNYSVGIDKLFGNSVPGYWRGIYKYFFDTDEPHTKPWEMLGFTIKPTWWDYHYGPAPYTKENSLLWTDLEAGFIYGGNPNASYINERYARPGLSQIIPVDEHGNLLNPNEFLLISYDTNYSSENWVVGDQGPTETAWRRSSDYPFAVAMAWCLAKPAEWCALKYNTRDLTFNSLLNQWINSKNNNREFDYSVTNENDYIPGYNVWLNDYLASNNLDVTENWINVVANSTFNLVYKMGSFTDKSYLTIVADQVSPQSTNSSVIIPQENYQVKVTKSAPVARATYSAVIVQKVTGGYQITGFDRERPYFLTIPSRTNGNNYTIVVGNERGIIYTDFTNGLISYPYGTIFTTKQQVVDFFVSYGRYLESQGFIFQNILDDGVTKQDWVLSAKEFLFWNQQNWGDTTVISVTPIGTSITFSSQFGVVDSISNTNNYTKIVNSDGVTLTGQDYRVYRDDNTFSVELRNSQKGIHLVDISIVQYEHTLIFDNITVFNDTLYDEQVGSRQFRLRLDGAKTSDWNGSLYAPGFFVNVSDIPQWSAYTDYYKGDIVLFKGQYFVAQDFIPGNKKFVISNWYLINNNLLSKNLIPNMASGAAQFINFHDPDTTDLNSAADLLSKSETGFSPRQYFTDLGLDITSQYKFYLGMVAQKGTQAVLNAYLRNKQQRIDSDITINEQWAIKLDNYGGTNQNDKLEFNIGNAKIINNQYLFEFINETDQRDTVINSIKPSDLLYKPRNYTTDIFSLTENKKQIVPTAGPVSISDINATVYDINKLYNISGLNNILAESSKIWIAADSSNQYGVYRLSQTGRVFVIYVSQISPSELQFTTNIAHNLNQYDYVMLKNGRLLTTASSGKIVDMSGFYRVSSLTNTTFNVKIVNNITVGSGELNAQLYKLVNVRFADANQFANFVPVRGWNTNEIVYIDNGKDNYKVLQNSNSWVYTQTKSPVFTTPTDNFGSSVRINNKQTYAIVGSSVKNNTGSAFVYGLRQDNTWQEIGLFTPDNRITSFGSNVDINNQNIAVINAPTAYKGIVYTGLVNTQQIKLNQAIHYDNLYVLSTSAFSQSNSYLLISNVGTFDNTANIALQASYNLSNFTSGMTIAIPGATNTIKISNVNYGYPYHSIGLSSNLATLGVTISPSTKIAIYPNVSASSQFGYSIASSVDGNWLFVGEPVTNSVYVYKYSNVGGISSNRSGDGVTTTFAYPSGVSGSANDVKIYINNVLKIPNLDYIKTPGQNAITFDIPPASTDTITFVYEPHYVEVNRIVTDDPDANGFGSSVSTNFDGTLVVIGAYNSNVNSVVPLVNAGKSYIYDRTAEVFVSDGSTNSFQLSNALSNLTTITTKTLSVVPSVTVDGVLDSTASFNLTTNQMFLTNTPADGSIIKVETNQFVNTKISFTDVAQQYSYYGTAVKTNYDGSIVFVGAPGYATSSSQNGAVFRLINTARLYGNIVGTKTSVNVLANSSIRINDYLVTFGIKQNLPYLPSYYNSNALQVANTINAANIPYISAGVTANNTVFITSSDTNSSNKIRIRNENNDVINAIGLTQWQSVQKLSNPTVQDTARFGEIISLNQHGNTLVVGSTLSNNKTTVTFDLTKTTFDRGGSKFIDTVYQSGAAHVYEYQAQENENYANYGSFVYGSLLQNSFAKSYDRYASGIDISQNYIMVGSPHANILNNPVGAMYVYYNNNAAPIWNTIRNGGVNYDSRKIDRVYLYNSTTAKLIEELPVYDLPYGYLPNSSESFIDYIINYDPAVYSNVPTTISFSYDNKNAWGKKQIGKLWWDINSIKYYDNTQGDNLTRFNYWGLAFPSSTINIYEWIESDVPPKSYKGTTTNNTPLYTINDVYSAQLEIDPSTGQSVIKYYFWVKNSSQTYNNNRPTAIEIQNYLVSPRNTDQPFAAVINKNSIAVFNASNLISVDTNLAIEYKNEIQPQIVHSEWTMFDDGSDLGVANEFLSKLNDSLIGQDASGRIVPDPKLPLGQRYGMNSELRQSLFKDNYYARKLFTTTLNDICLKYPMVLTRKDAVLSLDNVDPLPNSDLYKTKVANLAELGYLNKLTYNANDQVLVISDSNSYNNGWSLFKLVINPTTYVRTWEYVKVQTYNVNNYWQYNDWYSSKYNSQSPISHTVNTEGEISTLNLNINDIIYVVNSNVGGWKLVLVNANDLELLAQQNATIQFNSSIYDLTVSNQGYQTNSFQSLGFDTDNNLEFNFIFSVVRDKLLTNEYRDEFKSLVKLLIDTIASQHQQTDWMMKTSLVDINHRIRGLDQLPVYLPQPENTVLNFFNEVKPYHSKLKQYLAKYDNSNNVDYAYASTTDFDLQPYKNQITGLYRSPELNNSIDTYILNTNNVYKPWLDNHNYSVVRITVANGGIGYDGSTIAKVVGDGTDVQTKVYILNGSVNTIDIISSTNDWTNAKVYIFGVGIGAQAYAVLGNSLSRNLTTNIKFDRYQYFNSVNDWAQNVYYNINDVVVYNSKPYRVTVAHTSSQTFDITKFLELVIKVWYPQTEYAVNDVVVYKFSSYVVITDFTSGINFDTNNLSSYNGLWLDNACDRIWAYYQPRSGMAGRDLSQVMLGINYPSNQVKGPDFNQVPGYDVNYYDYIAYDYETKNVENVFDIFGNQAEDTYIRSLFTDTGLGLRPEDINIDGGQFIDVYSSHAPEEFVPGQIVDTLDIKVKTLPIINGGPDIKIFTSNFNSNNSFSFDPLVTGVQFPEGGVEKFYVIDRSLGPIAENYHYTVNYQQKTITTLYKPTTGTFFYVLMIGANGVNPVFDTEYYADGVQTDFDIADFTLTNIQQAYVKINGTINTNWSLIEKLENTRKVLAIRFNTPPNANDFVQIHLFNLPIGTQAYSVWHEQTFVISNANYPIGYNFTLESSEIYKQPISSYAIVRLNGSDLLPPQQSYYIGDGSTSSFSLTNSWIENIANITSGEIMVIVSGKLQVLNQDYTITFDPANLVMPIIKFTNAPTSGAKIIISDSSQSDFKIYNGNQLWINPNVVINVPSKLTVLTQGNHDPNTQYTKIFSGSTSVKTVVDNGLDTTSFDTVSFDNELNNYVDSIYYTLPHVVNNINLIYVTLKDPNTTGGRPLLPYRDFILVNSTTILLSKTLNISPTSVITVRIFNDTIRQNTLEYRIFKDMRDNTRYFGIKSKNPKLLANLHPSDNFIYVDSVSYLQSPEPISNNAGVVFVNGERITYGIIDKVNNRLGNLRRGTAGTGISNLHVTGTTVYDTSSSVEIPNSRDSFNLTNSNTYITNGTSRIFSNIYTINNVISNTVPLVTGINSSPNLAIIVNVLKNNTTLRPNADYVVGPNSVTFNSNLSLSTVASTLFASSNGNVYISNTYNVTTANIGQSVLGGNIDSGTIISNVINTGSYIIVQLSSPQAIGSNSNFTILDKITVNESVSTKMFVNANSYVKQGQMFTNVGESIQTSTTPFAQFIRSL